MSQIYLQEKLTGTEGQVVSFDIYNRPIIKTLTPTLDAKIYATISDEATVLATKGSTTIPGTLDSGYTYIINIPSTGLWTVTATSGSSSVSDTVNITGNGIYYITLTLIDRVLENNSWSDIQRVAQQSLGSSYWSVGDSKSILLSGKLGGTENYPAIDFSTPIAYKFFIIGFDHNSTIEGTGITFQFGRISSTGNDLCLEDFGYMNTGGEGSELMFNMNAIGSVPSNAGGWRDCTMRSNIIGTTLTGTRTFISLLPSDLKSVLKLINKYSDVGTSTSQVFELVSDYCFLLSCGEYTGSVSSYVGNEMNYVSQYTYYLNNSTVKYLYDISSQVGANWTRTRVFSNLTMFVNLSNDFLVLKSTTDAAIAPAFVVG